VLDKPKQTVTSAIIALTDPFERGQKRYLRLKKQRITFAILMLGSKTEFRPSFSKGLSVGKSKVNFR
jgi:hypothetical protein